MTFWILAALLSALSGAAILLGGRRAAAARRDGALAIFRDQMAELERDRARGLITGEEAEAAKAEIGRRMIAASRETGDAPERAGRGAVLGAAILVPVLGLGLYALTGSPGAPSLPFAERQEERGRAQEVADLTEELERRLLAEPDGGPTDGWLLLARTRGRQGDWAGAAEAYARVSRREGVPAGVMTQHAEALVAAADGVVTPEALALIDEALERDPTIPAGAFYKALAAEQAGDPARAREILVARLEQATGPEGWMPVFAQEATRLDPSRPVDPDDYVPAAPGPTAEQMAAAEEMSAEDREAMVRGMVDGLAARLAEDPGDVGGWLRLARARQVLGEAEGALEAARGAVRASEGFPAGDPDRAAALRLVEELGG